MCFLYTESFRQSGSKRKADEKDQHEHMQSKQLKTKKAVFFVFAFILSPSGVCDLVILYSAY